MNEEIRPVIQVARSEMRTSAAAVGGKDACGGGVPIKQELLSSFVPPPRVIPSLCFLWSRFMNLKNPNGP